MSDNNILEIKKAEEKAQKIILEARQAVEAEKAKIRNEIKNSEMVMKEKLKPKMEQIEKETEQAMKNYEKTASEEQKVAMEKLEDVDGGRMEKAVTLVIEHLMRQ